VFWYLGMAAPFPKPVIEGPSPSPELNPRAVAVLAFEDASAEHSTYLGDAIAQEVRGSLGRDPRVWVVARTSSGVIDRSAGARAIGERLGVAHVLDGTLRRDGDRLRLTAELVDVRTGLARWSDAWETDVDDLFDVQRVIASEVTSRVADGDQSIAALGASGPNDFRVYDAYLRGMAAFRLRDRTSLLAAVAHFEEALEQDPGYSEAWSGLAAALSELWTQYSSEPRGGPLDTRAVAAARRALALDPENAEAMRLLATPTARAGDVAEARALLARAATLRPGSVEVALSRGAFHLRHGEFGEALTAFETAVRIDPFSAITHLQLGRARFYAGDHEAALLHLERAAALNPGYPRVAAQRAIVLRSLRRNAEAREAFLRLLPGPARPFARAGARLLGDDRFARWLFAAAALRTGDPCVGRPEFAAHVYAAIGSADDMFVCLRREVLGRHPWYIAVEPIYDPYRDDPRFAEVLDLAELEPVSTASSDMDASF
jgi:serine/threonine-protein kinase